MSSPFRNRLLPWLAALLVATATPSNAASADDTVAATENDVELDEVLVIGKRLEERIVEAENEFYLLFNQVNKDDKFDVNCAYLNIDPDNRLAGTTQMCMPGFVADAIVDWTLFKMLCQPPLEGFDEFSCLDKNHDQRPSQREVAARPDLDMNMMVLDRDHNGYLTRNEFPAGTVGPTAPYQPPPPTLVVLEGTKPWYEHMMKVTHSDPRLLEMAGQIDDLHREYITLQRQEAEMRMLEEAARPKKVVEHNRGPRRR